MTQEKELKPQSGWPWLFIVLIVYVSEVVLFIHSVRTQKVALVISVVVLLIANIILNSGLTIIQPNEAGVFLLFGKYKGSCKRDGYWWVNPFYTKRKISLRLHTLNGQKIKVNDNEGNPVEIAAVVVWKVVDTYAACFDVENYAEFVTTQSETALRHLASTYPYDSWDQKQQAVSLRGNIDEVSAALERELQERLGRAGVTIQEARLSHLAYAPEIAEAMLRRQQATAIIAARQKIVEGAVGMVQMAIHLLNTENVIQLDEERKAAMVSNLLVVLCGETNAQPVINAGTLYH